MYDVIVVGGGPAGLAATIYCIRKRLDVLMITKDLGGKTNYRLQLPFVQRHQIITGEEVVNRFVSQIEYLDFARIFNKVVGVAPMEDHFVVRADHDKTYETRSIIVATGSRGQLLEVPGEKEFMMRGLCYSATSYAPVFIDREVAVVGDGPLALRSAAELATHASHVHLVARSSEHLASPLGRQLRQAPNVTILENYLVVEVLGDQFARSLVITQTGRPVVLEVDGIFVEQDLIPNTGPFAEWVDLDDKGRIVVDARNHTSQPGIFAAGDVTNTYGEQVLIAVGEGAKAALSAFDYLLEKELIVGKQPVYA